MIPFKRPPLSEKPGALQRDEVQCPICWSILIQPVTMPCRHALCYTCYQKNVEMASLQCPCCRLRLSVWSRRASRENKLIDQKLWIRIQREFPKLVETRLCGQDSQALGPLDLISVNDKPPEKVEDILVHRNEGQDLLLDGKENSQELGKVVKNTMEEPVRKSPTPPPSSPPAVIENPVNHSAGSNEFVLELTASDSSIQELIVTPPEEPPPNDETLPGGALIFPDDPNNMTQTYGMMTQEEPLGEVAAAVAAAGEAHATFFEVNSQLMDVNMEEELPQGSILGRKQISDDSGEVVTADQPERKSPTPPPPISEQDSPIIEVPIVSPKEPPPKSSNSPLTFAFPAVPKSYLASKNKRVKIQDQFPEAGAAANCFEENVSQIDIIMEPEIPENSALGTQPTSDDSGKVRTPDENESNERKSPTPPPISIADFLAHPVIPIQSISPIRTIDSPIQATIVSLKEPANSSKLPRRALNFPAPKRVQIKQEPLSSTAAAAAASAVCLEVNIKKEPDSRRMLIENEAQELIQIKLEPGSSLQQRETRRLRSSATTPGPPPVVSELSEPLASTSKASNKPSVSSRVAKNPKPRAVQSGRKRKQPNNPPKPKPVSKRSPQQEERKKKLEELKKMKEEAKLEEASRKLAERMQKMFDKGQDFPPPRSSSSRNCKKKTLPSDFTQ